MFEKIKSLFGRDQITRPQVPTIETVFEPERPFYAIGDIHGCYDQLRALMSKMDARANGDEARVFLGDTIDRGPDSARVLETLFTLQTAQSDNVEVIMGNHERMMLDFIDDPSGRGARWLIHGGVETMNSFGVSGVKTVLDAEDALDLADRFEAALPTGMQDWLRRRPLQWQNGNMYCVHASMNPAKSVAEQSESALLWGHPEFLSVPRDDGLSIVHGHNIVSEPTVCDGRISIDTGAYQGGKLTAVLISYGSFEFLQA